MTSTKRKPTVQSSNSRLNFRPGMEKQEGKGTRPLPEPSSVKNVLLMMLQHLCRRILFINTYYRVATYLCVIFAISIIMDFAPVSRTSVASKNSFLNTYFVKVGWGWTLLLGLPFVSVTSFIYSCGNRDKVLRNVARLAVATVFWSVSVHLFNYIENYYGRCNVKDPNFQTKAACLRKGYYWQSVDISGHCFILIYSTLVLIEECRIMNGWEGISDLIRDEMHNRSLEEYPQNTNPLRHLSVEEFNNLNGSYVKLTPLVRFLFIAITCLTIIWDMMLFSTIIYYHSMLEKFLGGLIAVILWYLTYEVWYRIPYILPQMPGDGSVKYNEKTVPPPPVIKRRQTLTRTPNTFMGMPLRVPTPDEKVVPANST